MKQIIISTMIATGLLQTAQAQHFSPSLGLELGYTSSNFNNPYYKENNTANNWQFAPNIGAVLTLANPEKSDWFLSLGCRYASFKQDFHSQSDEGYHWGGEWVYVSTSKTQINYLQVPIHIGYSLLFNKKWGICLGLGVTPAILATFEQNNFARDALNISFTETITQKDLTFTDPIANNYKLAYDGNGKIYNRFNLSAGASVGLFFQVSQKLALQANIQYQKGLTSIENHKVTFEPSYGGSDYKTYYDALGISVSEWDIVSPTANTSRLEKPNPFKTKIDAIGINLGIHYSL